MIAAASSKASSSACGYQHQATDVFSEIMTPFRFEQAAPLTPVTSQTTSGAECLGKYLGTGGEGNKGPFFGGFVWQADLPYNLSKMGAYV